jgi:hypothetical protein
MLEPSRHRAEGLSDPTELAFGSLGPAGVVLDDANSRVEAIVERFVSSQAVDIVAPTAPAHRHTEYAPPP